jgi:formate dehydrogenase iron-sulfur subunit
VACKEWKRHEAVPTRQRGTHQNPPDLTPYNFKLVRFSEQKIDGRIQWLFFPDQCRHCVVPPCKMIGDATDETAIIQDEATGAVLFTEKTKNLPFEDVRAACPYDIPRKDEKTGLITKCNMCIDRVQANMQPMCVKTCAMGAMNFGERKDMLALAATSLERVKKEHPKAMLVDESDVNVVYLITQPMDVYHKIAERQAPQVGPQGGPLSRKAFLAKLASPVRRTLV